MKIKRENIFKFLISVKKENREDKMMFVKRKRKLKRLKKCDISGTGESF